MALTPDMVRHKFSEFLLISDEIIENAIIEATVIMGDNVDRWLGQDFYYMANIHLVAHLAKVADSTALGDDSPLAPVKRTSVDNVEVDYAISSMTADGEEFLGTIYGRRYLMYRKMVFSGPITI